MTTSTSSSSSASSTTARRRAWYWWVNAVSFVSVAILGVVFFLAKVGWLSKLSNGLLEVANALAYVVVIACSFVYVASKFRKKHGIWYIIIWSVAVLLIVLGYIIYMVK